MQHLKKRLLFCRFSPQYCHHIVAIFPTLHPEKETPWHQLGQGAPANLFPAFRCPGSANPILIGERPGKAGALLFFIPGLIAALGYSMTFFILRDNGDMSVAEAMEESWTMMCGHKWACFRLWMSFIGWTILAVISVAGILWLVPYFCTAMAEFYNRVRGYRACCLG